MTMTEELGGAGTPEPAVDIVICTYNRASCLDAVLANLSRQGSGAGVRWRVLVVDNASTDATAEVVAIHRAKGALPGLRYVFESMPGLTAARQRGARETTAPWIAFVDDDNFLDSRWLEAIARAIGAHGEAGGIGGKVVLDWEVPPPAYLKEFGFCFAAQDYGAADCIVESLAGAGAQSQGAPGVRLAWPAAGGRPHRSKADVRRRGRDGTTCPGGRLRSVVRARCRPSPPHSGEPHDAALSVPHHPRAGDKFCRDQPLDVAGGLAIVAANGARAPGPLVSSRATRPQACNPPPQEPHAGYRLGVLRPGVRARRASNAKASPNRDAPNCWALPRCRAARSDSTPANPAYRRRPAATSSAHAVLTGRHFPGLVKAGDGTAVTAQPV